ncbi:MAG: SIR2 family protein [Gammaproteobacteria bacterium]
MTSVIAIEDFKGKFDAGEIIFFAGSGICYDSGLPTAADVLSRTAACTLPDLQESEMEEVEKIIGTIQPELFYETLISLTEGGSTTLSLWNSLCGVTQKRFGFKVGPNINHTAIVSNSALHRNPIFTTNFDTLFEDACKASAIPYCPYLPSQKNNDFFRDTRVRIVKLHGCINHSKSMLHTMTNITRKNLFWLDVLKESVRNKALCIVGYSGRDLDIFPTIKMLGREPTYCAKVLWINDFNNDYSDQASNECNALRIENKYPAEVFAEILPHLSVRSRGKPIAAIGKMLDDLQIEMDGDLGFTEDARRLMHGLVLSLISSHNKAGRVLESVYRGGGRGLTETQRARLYLGLVRNAFEAARFRDYYKYARFVENWARRECLDRKLARSVRVEALSDRAQAVGMLVPVNTYFLEGGVVLPVCTLLSIVGAIIPVLSMWLIARRGETEALSVRARQELLETRVRILATIQERFGIVTLVNVLQSRLVKSWNKLIKDSDDEGYAEGIANAHKFLARLDKTEASSYSHEQRTIHGLTTNVTGEILADRNEADNLKQQGRFVEATQLYNRMRDKAEKSGVVLSQLKALLGIADTRRHTVSRGAPLLTGKELKEFDELKDKVQGRLWKWHLARVRKVLVGEMSGGWAR